MAIQTSMENENEHEDEHDDTRELSPLLLVPMMEEEAKTAQKIPWWQTFGGITTSSSSYDGGCCVSFARIILPVQQEYRIPSFPRCRHF